MAASGAKLTPSMQTVGLKKILAIWPKTRKSNPLSKLLRPVFESGKTRTLLAAQGMVLLVATSASAPASQAFDYKQVAEEVVDASQVAVMTTKSGHAYPVGAALGVSQHYHTFHPGLDIRAPKGTPVLAVATGLVTEVREEFFGYGKHVRIVHDGTMTSLYAHLDEIGVEVGQRVIAGEEIGTIGTSGWATGPHLHLEIYEGQRAVNPAPFIEQ